MLIELKNITKIYNKEKPNQVTALSNVSLDVCAKEIVCLRGPSGSGKSTLLSLIGCIFPPTSGKAAIAGKQLSRLPDRFLTIHRRHTIGFIFQQFNILPEISVSENIELPLLPLGITPAKRKKRSAELMEKLGIFHRRKFLANQISGGELQRVAIARALINNPPIILADEPTAHLDTRLSYEFMDIIEQLRTEGKTIIITSHDPLVSEHTSIDRVVDISDGRLHAA